MINIDFSRLPEVVNPAFLRLFNEIRPTHLLIGGADSGKSYGTAQKYVYKILSRKYPSRILLVRKVRKDVHHSSYDVVKATIFKWGMEELFRFSDGDTYAKCLLNGADFIGVGLDDVNKLKSIYDPTDFWIEEADQVSYDDYMQLHLRLRGETPFTKTETLTMNPIWAGHWIKKQMWDVEDATIVKHHTTYRDNRFLDRETIDKLEKITDPYYKAVYVDGEWGIFGNVVFSNYVIEDFDYNEEDLENKFNGMDFGFVHASVIERGGFKDGDMYVFDELYGKAMTNADFIQNAEEYFGGDHYWPIQADSAEPDRIEEWRRAGWNVNPAKKGRDSLRFGIDFLSRSKIHVHKTKCANLAREIQSFKRKEDKNREAIEGQFVEINDDCIAALRYGTEPLWADMEEGNYLGGQYEDYSVMDYLRI